ncbi:2,4'-dihydroxyacetophenone dioxygenase family protein [Variovorax sp. J22G21]|uniref:2,4'-dihydroxyacetophenone dioxygenase family protein n=1 Tax=Variovorax ginsengisoli TaxID=363844 RepID=A0ABT8SEU4_9BURK|nr:MULTISPECIES: 2,4'-dihydroxyacetophenone dioxygenase family protein [Variovorax]MDM0037400.1 2,4'-dihydroxyacetophenone dioxygenase family protein [Variovorax sp. J22R193]MDM0062177.1 2,4'-dihydroxyacetophenone dioxygenase family protein [Variovorax sp. J22G21]MDN8618100.1 2,4'-dihydroxyacetophenone dioxygenase family protein [Variovorax ginsengisoli]MDO1537270.1 2,4'-dihydroxyacetophenone dioxygenase family protein [Variovorax ginsengisoli]
MTTHAAFKAPVFTLPQDELLTLNVKDIPVMKDALGPGIHFQPLLADPEAGVSAVIGIFAPGIVVPSHLHTGAVHGYTLKGSWFYKEYPDQVQTPGSYLYEPSSSMHTFCVPETNTEDTVVFFIVFGGNVHFDEEGKFISVLDAITFQNLIKTCAKAQGLDAVQYLKGGSAHYAVERSQK